MGKISNAVMAVGIAAAAFAFSAPAAQADTWPSRPIRMVVGFGAGGGTDIIARLVAQPLSEILGQPVVVENKPGAGGTIGADTVAKAAKDGYSIFMMNNGHAVSASLYKTLPYHSAKDFAPVSLVATMPLIIAANKDLPVADLKALVARAKAEPNKLRFASVGVGSTQHFVGAVFATMAGVQIRHVPYRGTPAAIAATRSGEVELVVEVASPLIGQIKGNELKALAVSSAQRYEVLPNVPTVAEAGISGFDISTWYGLAFPAGTPVDIVNKMNAAINRAVTTDAVRKQILDASFIPASNTPSQFAAHLDSEIARWGAVMKEAGVQQQ